MADSYSIYLHIPFCLHRCGYCDFNTYAGQSDLIPAYVDALSREIATVATAAGERLPVHTIFFGGGTPSLLPIYAYKVLLDCLGRNYHLDDPEISLEANPGTVTKAYLHDLRSLGFNRLSLGAQTFQPAELRLLERTHDVLDVIHAFGWARAVGFTNINMDLIFGLPEQTVEQWSASLKTALTLRPDHFSLYALGIEHGTPLGRWLRRGLIPKPDEDLSADMYDAASDRLEAAGFVQYEISNWAKPGKECQHNMQYWRCQPYLGFGAGAHGFACGIRYSNVLRPKTYIQRMLKTDENPFPLSSAAVSQDRLTDRAQVNERMMLGLRLTIEGIDRKNFFDQFGFTPEQYFPGEIQKLIQKELLTWDGDILRLTQRGRLLGNQVFLEFVS